MKSLKEFLNESRIGKISKTIKIDIRLEKTVHADERQSRHGTSVDKFISDDEIIETVRAGSERIIKDVLNDKISIGNKFVVRDANTDLNIVCKLEQGKTSDELVVVIITVIRTGKFFNQSDTNWVVMVR
jgi:hypothetical protein